VWADIWNIKSLADNLEAKLVIKTRSLRASVAPEKFGSIFFGEGDAGEGQFAPKASAAGFRGHGHAAELKGVEIWHFGHSGEIEGSDAEKLVVAKCAKVVRRGIVVAGEMGGGYRAAGTEDGVTEGKRLGGGDGEDGEQGWKSVISVQYSVFSAKASRILLKAEGGVFVEEEDEPDGQEDEGEKQKKGHNGMAKNGGVLHAAAEDDGDKPEDAG